MILTTADPDSQALVLRKLVERHWDPSTELAAGHRIESGYQCSFQPRSWWDDRNAIAIRHTIELEGCNPVLGRLAWSFAVTDADYKGVVVGMDAAWTIAAPGSEGHLAMVEGGQEFEWYGERHPDGPALALIARLNASRELTRLARKMLRSTKTVGLSTYWGSFAELCLSWNHDVGTAVVSTMAGGATLPMAKIARLQHLVVAVVLDRAPPRESIWKRLRSY